MRPGTGTPDLQILLATIQEDLTAVESWLEQRMERGPKALAPLLDHIVRFKGKRLRAAYVLLIARAMGEPRPEHIQLAGIVEMIHAATLIHDDMLDEARQRRQLDCVHVEWGPHTAVLLGDWVYSQAFCASTEMADQEATRVLATATSRICAGEIFQNLTRRDFELSEEDYYQQVDGKTAALFEAGGRLSAYYAGGNSTHQDAAAKHGLLAGRAFQVIDDILDLEGEEAKVGKSLGTDWGRGKLTLPLIRLRDTLDEEAREGLRKAFLGGQTRESLLQGPLADGIHRAICDSHQVVDQLLTEACASLEALPGKQVVADLSELTWFVGSRKH